MELKKTVVVGMSGGVDSTVAAILLINQGFEVIGITMKIWSGADAAQSLRKSGCYGPGEIYDISDAQQTCKQLGIAHKVLDLSQEYSQIVLQNFKSEYGLGRTPNPCILCNPQIKFGLLLEKARSSGINFDLFATGHYARITPAPDNSRYLLRKAADPQKDQSYFLYRLSQPQLKGSLFPLGDLQKKQVRQIAVENGLAAIAEKHESQEFIDGGGYQDLFDEAARKSGNILDTDGIIIGTHPGIIHFTLGQRKGLGIGGEERPLYVIQINAADNSIVVGPKELTAVEQVTVGSLNWIAFEHLEAGLRAKCRLRSHQKEVPCTISAASEGRISVQFEDLQYSATPGQSLVLYQEDVVLGGGIIEKVRQHHRQDNCTNLTA